MRKTDLRDKTHRKAVRILKKYMTKRELLNIQNNADLWELFEIAMKKEK